MQVHKDDLDNILFDLIDIRGALTQTEKNRPKDSQSECTIGDCLDDAILYLETIDEVTQ